MNNQRRLAKVLSDVLAVPADAINEETSVDSVKSWDSFNHMKLVLALESEFGISFTEEQTVEIISYPLIHAILQEHGVQFL